MQRYPLVDVLRAAAALLVMVYHVIEVGQWSAFPTEGWLPVFRIGWIGVDIFFVISGFVIGLSAIQSASRAAPWRRPFAERRVRRILPLYLLNCAVVLFLVNPAALQNGAENAAIEVITHLLFIHNLFPRTFNSINSPFWTIALEMQFYLLMLCCGDWLARATRWQTLFVTVGVAVIWRFGTTLALPPGSSDPVKQMMKAMQLPGVLDAFGVGIFLAKLSISGHLKPGWRPFLKWGFGALILLTLTWIMFWGNPTYWQLYEMIIGWRLLLALGAAGLLAALLVCPTDGGWLLRPVRYVGVISYGIYLWHYPVILALVKATPWRGLELLVSVFLGTVTLAAFSWHGFEKHWLRAPTNQLPMQVSRSL